ncbi:MAG: hypothetical protein AAGK00_14735 [Pseudomonadota bacterium]
MLALITTETALAGLIVPQFGISSDLRKETLDFSRVRYDITPIDSSVIERVPT